MPGLMPSGRPRIRNGGLIARIPDTPRMPTYSGDGTDDGVPPTPPGLPNRSTPASRPMQQLLRKPPSKLTGPPANWPIRQNAEQRMMGATPSYTQFQNRDAADTILAGGRAPTRVPLEQQGFGRGLLGLSRRGGDATQLPNPTGEYQNEVPAQKPSLTDTPGGLRYSMGGPKLRGVPLYTDGMGFVSKSGNGSAIDVTHDTERNNIALKGTPAQMTPGFQAYLASEKNRNQRNRDLHIAAVAAQNPGVAAHPAVAQAIARVSRDMADSEHGAGLAAKAREMQTAHVLGQLQSLNDEESKLDAEHRSGKLHENVYRLRKERIQQHRDHYVGVAKGGPVRSKAADVKPLAVGGLPAPKPQRIPPFTNWTPAQQMQAFTPMN